MILGVAGYSNTGKTGLVQALVGKLSEEGIRIATVKHAPGAALFPPEKDTTRHLEAGAALALALSDGQMVAYLGEGGDLDRALVAVERMASPDVILVEGFKGSDLPKIVLGEAEVGGEIVARGDDSEELLPKAFDHIMNGIQVERVLADLPGLDCRKCGRSSCLEMAEAVVGGKAEVSDCTSLHTGRTRITVNGEPIPVGGFVDEIVANTIEGMVSALKGGEHPETVEIIVRHGRSDDR